MKRRYSARRTVDSRAPNSASPRSKSRFAPASTFFPRAIRFSIGGTAGEERVRDLLGAEAAEDVEDERELRLLGQARMAAGEHHSQLLVADRGRREGLVDERGQRPLGLEEAAHLGREGARRALAPHDVERTVLRRRHQPRRRVVGNAARLPGLERAAERVLHHVLGEREVVDAEDARQRRDQPPRLAPKETVLQRR